MDHQRLDTPDPELPPRIQRKTIQALYEAKDSEAWHWRVMAALSSMLIAVGFLVFGGAFLSDNNGSNGSSSNNNTSSSNADTGNQTLTVTVVALAMVNLGYILSVALWFLRRNWLFQLECVFLPCLGASLLGFINTLVVPKLVLGGESLTPPALASLLVSLVSSTIYAVLAIVTRRRIEKLRRASPLKEQGEQAQALGLVYVSEEELQRRQMSNLLQQRAEITAAQLASQRTYHIDMPVPKSKRQDEPYDPPYNAPPSYTY